MATYQFAHPRDFWIRGLFVLSLAVLGYRVYACFQVPAVTSDVLRNLGYARHAFEGSFGLYNTIGTDFRPERWTSLAWREYTFQYPPVTLVFFYLFSRFELGIFWVKLTLTLLETLSAHLLYRRVSKTAALLFFCAPISWWFTSHEGQFEGLLTLLLILTIIAADAKRWIWAGVIFALALQTKQFAIFLGPWLLYRLWNDSTAISLSVRLGQLAVGTALGFAPFLGYYVQRPDLLLIPLQTASGLTGDRNLFNVFAALGSSVHRQWLMLSAWHTFFILLSAVVLAGSLTIRANRRAEHVFSVLPLVSFLALLHAAAVARLWYAIVGPGFLPALSSSRPLVSLVLLLYFAQGLPIVLALLTGNYLLIWGHVERQAVQGLMSSCMFTCALR